MISKEFRQGFFLVWAVLSFSALFILLAPLILPENTLYSIIPVCESRRLGRGECPLCGMTTAFIEISKGDFTRALYSNRASVVLYFILLANQFAFLGSYAFIKFFRRLQN